MSFFKERTTEKQTPYLLTCIPLDMERKNINVLKRNNGNNNKENVRNRKELCVWVFLWGDSILFFFGFFTYRNSLSKAGDD
ncbi:hypothetical protein K450DRAFT_229619 [Umbelopsis ramanniana AG]|uniref:Uncharacterized protein n=1 Tax=Umbelopsis ramanniana AG TaxID=1314678 RepID=A0AAD5EDG0_UMBRA|nr:uncharacterized protein K450DRAFT_229619 [Umbelopsis ramanniana AG]KAI8581863.1 hypothetical protein K450DRAFT_229619 [Umbelopsis ramanniana AG]